MKKRAAFTLIELLVVIAVIAALMGVLMLALNKARNLAQGAKCQGNLKTYTLAVAMYVEDHDGRYSDPGRCYFSQRDRYPVESGVGGNHLHLRWCNGDLNLKDNPEYGGHMRLDHVKNVLQSKKLASHDKLTLFDFTYDATVPDVYSSEILMTVTSLAVAQWSCMRLNIGCLTPGVLLGTVYTPERLSSLKEDYYV